MPFESQTNDIRNGISDIDMSIDCLGVVVLCHKHATASPVISLAIATCGMASGVCAVEQPFKKR
jgi:hypothetical protein